MRPFRKKLGLLVERQMTKLNEKGHRRFWKEVFTSELWKGTKTAVKNHFDLHSDAREAAKRDYCIAEHHQCILWHMGDRRNAFDTPMYLKLMGALEDRSRVALDHYRKHGGTVFDRQLNLNPLSTDLAAMILDRLTSDLEKKFGDKVMVCQFILQGIDVYYPHELEGKLCLFLDSHEEWKQYGYDTEELPDSYIKGIENWADAEHYLEQNGLPTNDIDYSNYIKAEPTQNELAFHIEDFMDALEKSGLSLQVVLAMLPGKFKERKMPGHALHQDSPDESLYLFQEITHDERLLDEVEELESKVKEAFDLKHNTVGDFEPDEIEMLREELPDTEEILSERYRSPDESIWEHVTDKDLQRAALQIVLEAGYDPDVLKQACIDAGYVKEKINEAEDEK